MKKSGLQDMKRRNRQLVIEKVLQKGGLSRIEIAQQTELSPSTVSGLVNELLEEGLLKESGVQITTAGRSRKELAINEDYGNIAVVEIGRKGIFLSYFNMAMQIKKSITLSEHYISGNELLSLIVDGIYSCFAEGENGKRLLSGIGLLFQEDMKSSDFNVMYSTGFASASISLKEALMTQFRVLVTEEYSQTYTVTNAMAAQADSKDRNSAHIAVGTSIVAGVTIKGKILPIKETFCEEAKPLLEGQTSVAHSVESQQRYLGQMIALLCMMFPLDTVFLSGEKIQNDDFFNGITEHLQNCLILTKMPNIRRLRPKQPESVTPLLAERIRQKILMA